MAQGAEGAEQPGVADQDVESSEVFVKGLAEAVDGVEIGQVQGHQGRRLAVDFPDFVVDFFQCAGGPGRQHQVRPFFGEAPGDGGADAPGRASDQGDAPVEPFLVGLFAGFFALDGHPYSRSSSNDN